MENNIVEFKRILTGTRGDSTYQADGFGTIYLAKSIKVHPESLFVGGLEPNPAKEAKPKLTKEERKAKRDAMTPEEKLAAAQKSVEAAQKRAAELAAKLAAPVAQ